jgi:hypothetical protein
MFNRLRFVLLAFASMAWVGAIITQGIIDNLYVNYPRTPDQLVQRIIPYSVKRIVVYLTPQQAGLLECLRPIEIASGVLIILLLIANKLWPAVSRR